MCYWVEYISYKYFLVVIFALRLRRKGYTDRFNLGLNNTTPRAHRFPPRHCVLTRHHPVDHVVGYTQTLQPHIFFVKRWSNILTFFWIDFNSQKLLLNSWII